MKITRIRCFGWENAIIGMRFPKNSEAKSDSHFEPLILGKEDYRLICNLIRAGKDHRKFLRMIHVQCAINMPISWWIQYDTYKVGTVANSRSRMHKFGERLLSINDFESDIELEEQIDKINSLIVKSNKIKETDIEISKKYWKQALDLLPMCYQQERMIDLNYEVLLNICKARYNEKLNKEWRFFIDTLFYNLPYLKEFYSLIV